MKIMVFLFFAWAFSSVGQSVKMAGARQNALGNSALNVPDLWAVKNNPGAFAFLENSQIGLSYQNRFILSELMTQGLVYARKTGRGNLGFHVIHHGFSLFRNMQVGTTYALALSPRLGMGIGCNYYQTRFGGIYGVKHHFIADVGIQYKVNKNFFFGVAVLNINRSRVGNYQNERLPTTFGLGILCHLSESTMWAADMEKEITGKLNLKTGLEIKTNEHFDIRFGINTYPFQSSFGFGLQVKSLQIDFAAIWHAHFGLSPSFGLIYEFK